MHLMCFQFSLSYPHLQQSAVLLIKRLQKLKRRSSIPSNVSYCGFTNVLKYTSASTMAFISCAECWKWTLSETIQTQLIVIVSYPLGKKSNVSLNIPLIRHPPHFPSTLPSLHPYPPPHTDTCMHTHTRMHARSRARTHTHTHTLFSCSSSFLALI